MSANQTHPRLRKLVNLGVVILLGITAWYSIQAYNGIVPHQYVPPFLEQNGTFSNPRYNFTITVPMDYFVKINTTSLSAQNEIDVSAKLYLNKDFIGLVGDNWKYFPDNEYMVFPDALKYPPTPTPEGSYYSGYVLMNKTHTQNDYYYYGTGKIYYQFQGEYGFVMLNVIHEAGKQSNGITRLNATTLKHNMNKDIMYFVGGSDLTDAKKTNDIFMMLTLVLVGFGLVESKDVLANAIIWLSYDLPAWILRRLR